MCCFGFGFCGFGFCVGLLLGCLVLIVDCYDFVDFRAGLAGSCSWLLPCDGLVFCLCGWIWWMWYFVVRFC